MEVFRVPAGHLAGGILKAWFTNPKKQCAPIRLSPAERFALRRTVVCCERLIQANPQMTESMVLA
jgi:hypothetical protein